MQDISWLANELSVSQEWLYHVELVLQKRPFPSACVPIRHSVTKLVFDAIHTRFPDSAVTYYVELKGLLAKIRLFQGL
jgi:hypothetical protein